MNQIKTSEDIKKLGTILTVWAHPDDESFLAAGIIATAVSNGQKVACITATKGEEGVQNEQRWPHEHLGEIRKSELMDALKIIGVDHHHWLDYHDGECARADAHEAVDKIVEYINLYKPDTILTFGPDGWTGHPDHQTVSAWVSTAVGKINQKPNIFHVIGSNENYEKYLKLADEKANIFYNIEKPPLFAEDDCDICFDLPEDICEQKCRALAAMPSQTEALFGLFDKPFIKKAWSQECFSKSD